jgi:hypothetical protein
LQAKADIEVDEKECISVYYVQYHTDWQYIYNKALQKGDIKGPE